MKKLLNSLFIPISKSEMETLTKDAEVKETIDFGNPESKRRIFTNADLWNIHRNIKGRTNRRFL